MFMVSVCLNVLLSKSRNIPEMTDKQDLKVAPIIRGGNALSSTPVGKSLTAQILELRQSLDELKELFNSKINTFVTIDDFNKNDLLTTDVLKNHAEAINALQEIIKK